jgi:hypothetical protein
VHFENGLKGKLIEFAGSLTGIRSLLHNNPGAQLALDGAIRA